MSPQEKGLLIVFIGAMALVGYIVFSHFVVP